MEVIAWIKENIIEIHNTKTEQNIAFANKLEKGIITYLDSKTKSTVVRTEDILKLTTNKKEPEK